MNTFKLKLWIPQIVSVLLIGVPLAGDSGPKPVHRSAAASAQSEIFEDVERVLVPVVFGFVPGGFDSNWVGSLLVRNDADAPVLFFSGDGISHLPGGGLVPPIPPHTTLPRDGHPDLKGDIFVFDRQYADKIHLSHRIADVSRRPISLGAEVPAVREEDWLALPAELLDVSTDFSVRQRLRVYEPEGTNLTSVRVTVYPLFQSNEPLAEVILEPRGGIEMKPSPGFFSGRPAYAEIPDLVQTFPQLASHDRLRVLIEPLTPGMRYWAFITVTDNMTQQVTVISPR